MENLYMYNKYKQPPKDALKDFNNGRFKGTDINPMWRIKVLTEEYGECGFGWYAKVNRYWKEESPNTQEIAVFCEVELYVNRDDKWSMPIVGVGGNTFVANWKNGLQASDEAYKMAYTDALGIACKALGIGADVWWKSPDSKYARMDECEKPKCEKCGAQIVPLTTNSGKAIGAEQLCNMSVAKYGKIICIGCAEKMKQEGKNNE